MISWGSCSNPGQGNGSSFYSINYGTSSVTACYVPYGYTFTGWNCTGGVVCSGTDNPTTVTIVGPGTITLDVQTQTTEKSSTLQATTLTSTTSMLVTTASYSTQSTVTTTTYSTAEFSLDRIIMVGTLLSVLLIAIRRKTSPEPS